MLPCGCLGHSDNFDFNIRSIQAVNVVIYQGKHSYTYFIARDDLEQEMQQ